MIWNSPEGEPVVSPKHFSKPEFKNVQLGIMVFTKRSYECMRDAAKDVSFEADKHVIGSHSAFVTVDGLGVFHSYFGAPAAVALAESLIAGGVRNIVILGEAGSLSPSIDIGDVLLPRWALREEGTSYHYMPPQEPALSSDALHSSVKHLLESERIPLKEGGVWTTDAIFRETKDKVTKHSASGCLAVEMECSALFSVSSYHGIQAAAVLTISDRLHSEHWEPAFDDARLVDKERTLSELLTRRWSSLLPCEMRT